MSAIEIAEHINKNNGTGRLPVSKTKRKINILSKDGTSVGARCVWKMAVRAIEYTETDQVLESFKECLYKGFRPRPLLSGIPTDKKYNAKSATFKTFSVTADDIKKCAKKAKTKFTMPVNTWAMVLYETAATFHRWQDNRTQLVNLITPLYLGRVASFINQTSKMSSVEAEAVVEQQAQIFEDEKDYLIQVWDGEK